ncbi:MAG: MiaB/RimO family radical SAM methylthiotransferase [Atopobiaceae bacterium]
MTGARPKVAFVNLGCRVNRVETDVIMARLERAGAQLVDENGADLVVINTCAVTGEAEAKTRKVIRHAASLPQAPAVVATGCVASLFSDELAGLGPNVSVEPDKTQVASRALELLGLDALSVDNTDELAVTPTPTGRMRPGIKVQDGCDNRCTYCIVWKARGRGRSLDPERVVSAVQEAVGRGAHEVVLTGINLGRYGALVHDGASAASAWEVSRVPVDGARSADASEVMDLAGLLELILERTTIERVRLSSIEPPDVDDRLLSTMAASDGRVAPFLHICLQSGCDATLRRMGRVYDSSFFAGVVENARRHLPHLALGTDLIVGFPGETDQEFQESLDFCRSMRFSKMHVFRYSRRPGTPAAEAVDQVSPQVMARRSHQMRQLASAMRAQEAQRLVGTRDRVLVQYPGRAVSGGLFDVLVDPRCELGSMVDVQLEGVSQQGDGSTLVGRLL